MPNPLSAEATCTVKYQGRTLTVPAGSARDVKVGLSAWTAVAPNAIKLIRAGKVLGDDDEVAPKAKLMMMRCTPPNPTLHLCVREIVTGRLAPRLDVSGTPCLPFFPGLEPSMARARAIADCRGRVLAPRSLHAAR